MNGSHAAEERRHPAKAVAVSAALAALLLTAMILAMSSADTPPAETNAPAPAQEAGSAARNLEKATFGNGCFWCTEAIFKHLQGVESAVSGYSGGHVENPTYKQVCTGTTGHAEVIQVTFDPDVISYDELLEVFWKTHDPTTLNRQGNDVGPQYRSAVFYHAEEQREAAEKYKKKLNESGAFEDPIVTEITAFEKFYPAEDYHQDYYELNGQQPYCQFVIRPKLDKFKKVFAEKLREEQR